MRRLGRALCELVGESPIMLSTIVAPGCALIGGALTHSWFGSTSWLWIIGSGLVGVLATLGACRLCRRLALQGRGGVKSHIESELWTRHGAPIYLLLLGGNVFSESPEAQRRVYEALLEAVLCVPKEEVERWLSLGWRERLVAGWIFAARRLDAMRPLLKAKLLQSEVCFAGEGLALAVARFGDAYAQDDLEKYLQEHPPGGKHSYDQEWVIGALVWLDGRIGTTRAAKYLASPGIGTRNKGHNGRPRPDPSHQILMVSFAMQFLDRLEVEALKQRSTPEALSHTVVLLFGKGRPLTNEKREEGVIKAYGHERGAILIAGVNRITLDAYKNCAPDWKTTTLEEHLKRFGDYLRSANPDLSSEAVNALVSYEAFSWR